MQELDVVREAIMQRKIDPAILQFRGNQSFSQKGERAEDWHQQQLLV